MDARAWAKNLEKQPDKAAALAALAKLPKAAKPGRVGLPFPVGEERSPYDKVIGHKSLQKRIASAPVQRVPIGTVVSNGQKSVRVDQVEHYIDSPDSVGGSHGGKHATDHPIVVRVNGKNVLYDGHHRVTAAKLRGEKDFAARVVDLDSRAKRADKEQ